MWILLAVLFLVRYAEPVKDGDVFFHIKYGEYHIQNHTWLADHSIYSWTPAAQYATYCTWAADVLLYLLFQAGGWPLLFIFKYICMFIPILMVWLFSRKVGLANHIITFFVLTIVLFATVDAAYIKPEIISLVFFSLVASLYFFIKIDPTNNKKSSLFFLYPLIFLCWVNMHGVFLFGLILLATIICGEWFNYLIKSRNSFPKRTVVILTISVFLSVAATLLTPYGFDYHSSLFMLSTQGGLESNVVKYISAYHSILNDFIRNLVQHNLEYWGIMIVLFVIVFFANAIKKRNWDFGLLLPTLFLSFICIRFQRSTYYWPPFWAMSVLYLFSKEQFDLTHEIQNMKPVLRYALILLISSFFIYIPARALYEVYLRPARWMYFGFGFSYVIPVQESTFLKENKLGTKLFNSYNSGTYVIFDQFPERKVFIDARYFPYRGYTYDKYMNFREGATSLQDMESEFNFDTALILHNEPFFGSFLKSKDWKPVFYGTGGVVFIRKDIDFSHDLKLYDKHRFDGLRNLIHAADVVVTAQNLNDLNTADYVIGIMNTKLKHLLGFDYFYNYCTVSQQGLRAYEQGDYAKAFKYLWSTAGINLSNIIVNRTLKNLTNMKVEKLIREGKHQKALNLMTSLVKFFPYDADIIYNAGVVDFIASNQPDYNEVDTLWKILFQKLLEIAPNHQYAEIAKQVLQDNGNTLNLPFIVYSN